MVTLKTHCYITPQLTNKWGIDGLSNQVIPSDLVYVNFFCLSCDPCTKDGKARLQKKFQNFNALKTHCYNHPSIDK